MDKICNEDKIIKTPKDCLDDKHKKLSYPDDKITEKCCSVTSHDIYIEKCDDVKFCDLGKVEIDKTGKILFLSVTVKDVCPNKKAALGIMLSEVDKFGCKYPRGFKTCVVYNYNPKISMDIKVSEICFVLPDSVSVGIFGKRHFVANVVVNYLDVNKTVITSGDCCTKEK